MVLYALNNKINSRILAMWLYVTLNYIAIAEIITRARFAFLVVDLEYTNISVDMVGVLILAIDICW